MSVNLVEYEIVSNTKISTQRTGEDGGKYRARLVRAAFGLANETWKGLSEPTQVWVNDGVAAINAKITVPPLPAINAPASVKELVPATPVRKRGACNYLRSLFIRNPETPLAELIERTREAGYTIAKSSAEISYQETKATLKVLRELKIDVTNTNS